MIGFDSSDRRILAILVIVVTGFWGFVITFSDSPPDWSLVQLTAYIVAWHIPSAFLVGYLIPHRWFMGTAVSWGTLLMLFGAPAVVGVLVAAAAAVAYVGRVVAKRRGRPHSGD